MKKAAVIFLALILGFLSLWGPCAASYAAQKTVTITVYNWGQYISDGSDGALDVIEAFEEAYPYIKVNYVTYDSNETLYSKLKTGGTSYDVIIPSDYMIEKLIEEDMLLPLDFSNIPNYEYIDEDFKGLDYDPDNIYSVPYTWGCVGIVYNTSYVSEEDIGSWDLLWNPVYTGKILMFDNSRDAFAIAELLLGFDINTEDEEELEAAAEKLEEQKPLVQSYVMDQIFEKMEREEAWIAPCYAGDYLTMAQENPDLGFYFPEEGYNLFVDAMCIPSCAEHKSEAELFINFMCDPEICAANLDYIGYSSPSSASKEYMDEDRASSEIIYPDGETLSKGETFKALSEEGTQAMNELWLSVKTSDNVLARYLILTGGAILIVVILWMVIKLRKRRRKKHRCRGYA